MLGVPFIPFTQRTSSHLTIPCNSFYVPSLASVRGRGLTLRNNREVGSPFMNMSSDLLERLYTVCFMLAQLGKSAFFPVYTFWGQILGFLLKLLFSLYLRIKPKYYRFAQRLKYKCKIYVYLYIRTYTDSEGERNVSLMTKASKTTFCYRRRNNLTDRFTDAVGFISFYISRVCNYASYLIYIQSQLFSRIFNYNICG